MPAIQLFSREDKTPGLNPIYTAGFVVVGVIALGLAAWLGIRTYRKKSVSKREKERGLAFLSVRGVVKDSETPPEKEPLPEGLLSIQGSTFSRDNLTPSIVLPSRVLVQEAPKSREEILQYHRQSGNFPRPFSPKPFSFALSANSGGSPRVSLGDDLTTARGSFAGVRATNRFSVLSTSSSTISTPTPGTTRKVRQLFNPVLPDELLVGNIGESLSLLQSFDDGWCIVGRENSSMISTAKSLFSTAPAQQDNIELGVVPAWCFLKPVQGLRAERPIRSSSLGVTVQMQAPGFSSRDEVISWANF
ncbi:hypothetical protein BD779DRAFT_1433813 [Infundibulicybe gibba]|nr:hypothetical protein BD779DRAFT_1433813 [Infundibulicybe gibba]